MDGLRFTPVVSALVVLALAVGACSDDVVGGQTTCPADDETYHPIEERCVVDDNAEDNQDTNGTDNTDPNGEDNTDPNGEDNTDPNGADGIGECGPGAIEGRTCRPDGEVLAGAEVTVSGEDCEDGEPFEMTTEADQDGYYTFTDVPAGEHTLTVESGSFSNQQPVTVYKGETTNLLTEAAKVCVEGTQVSIAVVQGAFDDVGSILDGMGLQESYDTIGETLDMDMDLGDFLDDEVAEFLGDIDQMRQYDIIFIECGNTWSDLAEGGGWDDFFGGGVDIEEVKDNVETYVREGNSLYVSDWAHPFVQETLPEVVEFYQEDDDDVEAPRAGAGSQEVDAEVVSPQMQTLLGADEPTELNFNLDNWAIAEDSGEDSMVHFEADVEMTEGETVEDAALMITDEDATDGSAIFTSFHNNDQATGEMEEILEYMIFQL